MASGTHFLSFSQTTLNWYLWKQFILQLEHIFQLILHSSLWKRVFCLLETILFYSKFFLLVETITENWGKSIFKDEISSCKWKSVFSIFSGILRFLKVEATFPYSGNAFFNKFFIWLVEMDFLASGNQFFLYFSENPVSDSFFCLMEMMFQENPSFQLVEIGFRAKNGFHNEAIKKEYCFH